jgi:tetratricopeptide (TPR) repeat protein
MEAEDHYKTGLDLKSKGQMDLALTEFRRAVIADPSHVSSQVEIGLLCREKSKSDKMFMKYSFEAFQKAARLDPTNEQAHTYYITVAQKMGALDNLLDEYSALSKKFPDNALLQQSHKNIIALTMAMMPQQVNVGSGGSSGARKFMLIFSFIMLLAGVGFIIAPPVLLKQGKIQKDQVAGFVRIGLMLDALGVAGFIVRTKLQ